METPAKYQPRVEKIERVWTPEAKLWVPHNSGEIAFASPVFGPDRYVPIGQDILSKNLKVPTGDYIASLLHSAYCTNASNEPKFKNIQDIMKSNRLWVFNRNLWTEKGVYVLQDEDVTGSNEPLNVKDLEKMLKGGKDISGIRFSKDGKVRFAPKGSYILGKNTSEAFAKDGFIIASCGKEGAEKLGEVSAKFSGKPYTCSIDVQEGQSEQRVSAVDEFDVRLRFDGSSWFVNYRGLAFGVLK